MIVWFKIFIIEWIFRFFAQGADFEKILQSTMA